MIFQVLFALKHITKLVQFFQIHFMKNLYEVMLEWKMAYEEWVCNNSDVTSKS